MENDMQQQSNPNPSGFLTKYLMLGSILLVMLLAGVVVFKLSSGKIKPSEDTNSNASKAPAEESAAANNNTASSDAYKDVTCVRFTSVEEALKYIDKACVLDLSGQNLTTLPKDVLSLTKLSEIDLSNNSFTTFPKELLTLNNIMSINLTSNNISTLPVEILTNKTLQSINVSKNPIKERLNPDNVVLTQPLPPTITY